jgi:hypothetical protein
MGMRPTLTERNVLLFLRVPISPVCTFGVFHVYLFYVFSLTLFLSFFLSFLSLSLSLSLSRHA